MAATNHTDRPQRPREIERYIASRVRKLADSDLMRLLETLRSLATKEAGV